MLAVLSLIALLDELWRPPASERGVWAHLGLDLCALAALVALSPDAHQPLQGFFVIETALAAAVLPHALAAAAVAAGLQAVATLIPGWAHPERGHLAAHALLIGSVTVITAWLVSRLSASLRDHREAAREAERALASAERLAAVGTLAAGLAHELGTPLGAITLLSEEAVHPKATPEEREAALVTLRTQVDRCRQIVDRLGAADVVSGTTPDVAARLAEWVHEWTSAHGGVALAVEPGCTVTVTGPPDRWRAALWTLLDNARAAGGPVDVRATPGHTGRWDLVRVEVRDRGCGVDADTATRAGEPFFTAWPQGGGRGLGLHGARTFARAVGGDLTLRPRDGGGAVATLILPVCS